MSSNTPQTSPSSNGATSATVASLSPKDLTDEFHEQVPSKTSVQPKHDFPVSAIDTATAVGDNSGRNQRRNTMLESAMGLMGDEHTKFSFYRLIIGSMFAYVVLGIWVWTVCQFIHDIDSHSCTDAYTGLKDKLAADSGLVDSDTISCLDLFTGTVSLSLYCSFCHFAPTLTIQCFAPACMRTLHYIWACFSSCSPRNKF